VNTNSLSYMGGAEIGRVLTRHLPGAGVRE
jgi:hypothetical protein